MKTERGGAATPSVRRPLLRTLFFSLWAFILAGFLPAGAAGSECKECHQFKAGSQGWRSVHDPFKENDCLSCHQEHGEKGELLLAEEGNALCASCHEAGEDDFKKAHRQIDVSRAPCNSCHNPHASEKVKLLRSDIHRPLAYGECQECHREGGQLRSKTVALLCYRCHDAKTFTGASRHEPVAGGECTSCHDPHGSPNPVLLTAPYTLERYAPFAEKTYAICFSCHELTSFTIGTGDADTGFKDQRTNLHYLHSVKQGTSSAGGVTRNGTTCRNCHLPHASIKPHLVRENLDCGQGVFCLRLLYTEQEGGGVCGAGCHLSATYSVLKAPSAESKKAADKGGQAADLPAAANSFCLECHQKQWQGFQKAFMHDPVRKKRCEDCHLDHGKDNKLILVAYEGRLCARCHDEKSQASLTAHAGYAVGNSNCIACHDPHSSDNKPLLYPSAHEPFSERSCGDCHEAGSDWTLGRAVNLICADCHEKPGQQKNLHGAVTKNSCVGCHSPHAAAGKKLLSAEGADLCYRCHERAGFVREFKHEPVAEGDCATCHDVHGSERPNLLVNSYPLERYQAFRKEDNELCFSCHDVEPFTEPDNTATNFRGGKVNLHYLHVSTRDAVNPIGRKQVQGTTCRNCHEPHSTGQPSLVRQSLDCGGVPCLTLEFKRIGGSARCSKGCHTPQIYSPY